MITFVCWKWKSDSYHVKYTAEHANVWNASLRRTFKGELRTVCVTDDPAGVEFETFPLWSDCGSLQNPSGKHLPSCYRRLKLFSSLVQSEMDIEPGSIVVSVDLDAVFVRDTSPLFEGDHDFIGWRGINGQNLPVYNGSLFLFKAGAMDFLWDEFDTARSPLAANGARYFGSDQGWLSYRLAGSRVGWNASHGVLSYTSDMRAHRAALPPQARVVFFNGKKKPWEPVVQSASPWIKQLWRS